MDRKEIFTVHQTDHVAWLMFNRPEKRNTMTADFYRGIKDHFNRFDADPDVRVVVMGGEGKSFTAGTDFEALQSLAGDGSAASREITHRTILWGQDCFSAIERCRKPTIAAIHSHCIGGGVDLICACDIRIASRDAIFSIRETRLGFIADAGTLQRLPFIIGQGMFRQLSLTGRDFSAEEAFDMGLITGFYEDRDDLYRQAQKLAETIAKRPPLAVQHVKEAVILGRDRGVHAGLRLGAQKHAATISDESGTS
ncbi:MAG TPA: enoyl-CoA hydratase-related protein [Syntrophales bacterium]|nr:enoyl-CoA hydratase-related protein [Syntrophales bacterium]HPQ44277.1 enoyl-CoA hydratase-related protein [Syntrophales bacterium]